MRRDNASAPPSVGGADPRPCEVITELERLERRWSQLPLERAERALPTLRATLDSLTAASGRDPVPDLGPGSALHQLKVLVWEACLSAARDGSARQADGIRDLVTSLSDLRRALP